MKKAHLFRVLIIVLIILLPLSRVNTEMGAISDIDNKYLTDFPDVDQGFSSFMQQTNDYLNDRLGGRGRLLQLNSTLNDRLFGYLEHPSYEYGEDGYVFFKMKRFERDFEFIDTFTDLLLDIQNYCHERNIPFVYELNPAKTSIYTQHLPEGYRYQNDRLEYLQKSLVDKGIVHVDATVLLQELSKTEQVFNKKYDAGHWNALGAFYSVNQILEKMAEYDPRIKVHDLDDFNVEEKLVTEYPVSKVKMHEYIPVITPKNKTWEYVDMGIRNEIIQSPRHQAFFRTENEKKSGVHLLMFHGSGFNGLGHPFIAQAVETYQGIHNYENLIDFDYYFNLFRPNFVLVNSAEYATTEGYFSIDKMMGKQFNPVLEPELFTERDEEITPLDTLRDVNVTTVWFEENSIEYGYYVDDNAVYDLVYDQDEIWYFSAFNDKLDLSSGKLYLAMTTGEKIVVQVK